MSRLFWCKYLLNYLSISEYGSSWLFIMLYFSYLELAILPCRCFLDERPQDCLQRLVMMIRGLGDPLASAYCRLYLARCMRKLPSYDIGKEMLHECIFFWIPCDWALGNKGRILLEKLQRNFGEIYAGRGCGLKFYIDLIHWS